MDIEGLGKEMVDQLVDSELVKVDCRTCTGWRRRSSLALERTGEKSAQNLLDGIAASKGRGLARVLAGIGVPASADSMADILAQEFLTIDALMAAPEERLLQVKGVGRGAGQGDPRLLPGRGRAAT